MSAKPRFALYPRATRASHRQTPVTQSHPQNVADVYHTPIAQALKGIRDRDLISFHALPLLNGASLKDCPLSGAYRELFGDSLFRIEHTVSGEMFDSFFFPSGVIQAAEQQAAATFGADGTMFVTSGTTVSNQIAVAALCRPGDRVLIDRQSHQSLHFSLKTMSACVDYLLPTSECKDSGRAFWAMDNLITRVRAAEAAGAPYSLIVLNACSYDGVVYDIPRIIGELLSQGCRTRKFLVDEAWGIGNYFIDGMTTRTAMATRPLLKTYTDLVVVATQSAHKSMGTMRQASMVHHLGSSIAEKLRNEKFKLHTTSPSYPILASLDLARAQMQVRGRELLARSVRNAASFRETVENDQRLSMFRINDMPALWADERHLHADPTKVSVNVASTEVSPKEVRAALFSRHSIYVHRITETSLLFNFHIGVSPEMLGVLVDALREIQLNASANEPDIEDFIISYPPGIPIAVPGDRLTSQLKRQMMSIRESGNLLVRA